MSIMSFLPSIIFIWTPILFLTAFIVFLVLYLKERKMAAVDASYVSKKLKVFQILFIVFAAIFVFFLAIDLAAVALVGLFMASM